MSEPKSTHLDSFRHGSVFLTLATWDSGYGPSPEIGYRDGMKFELIQWSGIRTQKAWDIAKRLVIKGRPANKIQTILDRLEHL